MARLAANPTSAGAVVDVVREVVDEPGYPVFSEAISLLRFSRVPAATDLLLRLIERPANPLVLRAALVTYTAQRDGGPIRELPSLRAARLAVQALRGPYATYRVRRAAADLLHALPEPHPRQLLAALGREGMDPAALSVLRHGTALDVPRRRALTQQVYASLESRLGSSDLDEDPELRRRVVLALEHANDEVRGQTLLVFMLSPLAPTLAAALSGALHQAIAERDMTMAQEALRPLTYLSGPAQLDELTQLVVEPLDVPGGWEVAGEAAWVLGNVIEPSGPAADQRDHLLAAALTTGLSQPYRGSLPHALGYALAMRRRADLLVGLSAIDGPLDQSLRWWLAHPLAQVSEPPGCQPDDRVCRRGCVGARARPTAPMAYDPRDQRLRRRRLRSRLRRRSVSDRPSRPSSQPARAVHSHQRWSWPRSQPSRHSATTNSTNHSAVPSATIRTASTRSGSGAGRCGGAGTEAA